MTLKKEEYDLPEWAKLVNRLLHGQETLEDVRPSGRARE
jgi:hypothetical protein